ncbi:MAG: acyl-CoA thioesterase [Clostridiaceae bacterium]|nr:acyl-CoA thioesterase [Clostridiaceae bacterium]
MNFNETKVVVRYAETDKMGVVYHSNYLIYFEIARTEFINQCGMSYRDMEDIGIMIPVLESNCKYMNGAKYNDELTIKAWIEELSAVRAKFNYSIIREKDQKEIARGNTLHTFVDNNFKIINLKKKYPEVMSKLEQLL